MSELYLTNSLSGEKEKFEPINPPDVGLYTCGMTVYDYAHIGHGRKYVADDILKRTLVALSYKVKHVQNVTDVGHLTSDADTGEDKMEKGAKKTGKTVWEIAQFFTDQFYSSMDALNILRPDVICKATEHINEQIILIKELFRKGFVYDTPEAVYYDVSKFPGYGEMFGQSLSDKKTAAREEVKTGDYKKNPADFVLWFKRVGGFENHTMHWDSPWGDGFPGWHIECSAMSMKYLGPEIDIHTGGEDHLPVHHPNEIAQSEGATGVTFAKYWLHTAHLMVDGRKMSKSLANFYTVNDIIAKGYSPIALRYLFLGTHYRKHMNFTWESLDAAAAALTKMKGILREDKKDDSRTALSQEKNVKVSEYRTRFMEAICDDFNTPAALAVAWEVLKSNIPSCDKYDLLMIFDEILGLKLNSDDNVNLVIPAEVTELLSKREAARINKDFAQADIIRDKIEGLGYKVVDSEFGAKIDMKRFN